MFTHTHTQACSSSSDSSCLSTSLSSRDSCFADDAREREAADKQALGVFPVSTSSSSSREARKSGVLRRSRASKQGYTGTHARVQPGSRNLAHSSHEGMHFVRTNKGRNEDLEWSRVFYLLRDISRARVYVCLASSPSLHPIAASAVKSHSR